MLLTALADNPSTPIAAVVQVADTVHQAVLSRAPKRAGLHGAIRDGGTVLAHPNLPTDHPVLTSLHWNALSQGLTSPLLTDDRARLLISRADPGALTTYLRAEPDPHPSAFSALRNQWHHAGLDESDIHNLARHSAAPDADVLEALRWAVAQPSFTGATRASLVTAATRHPSALHDLAHLATDVTLVDQLNRYARTADPYAARIADIITTATTSQDEYAWERAIGETGDPTVIAAALTHAPTLETWNNLLDARIPDAVKAPLLALALTTARTDTPWVFTMSQDVARLARPADLDTLTELTGATRIADAALPGLLTRADLPAEAVHIVLDRLTVAHDREYQRNTATRSDTNAGTVDELLTGAACVAAHPNTSPDDRIRAHHLASAIYHLTGPTNPDPGAAAYLEAIGRGPARVRLLLELADVGRRLVTTDPVAVARGLTMKLAGSTSRDITDEPGLRALVQLALTARTDDLADPDYTRALLALTPDFAGTLGELLDTARIVAT